MVQHSLELRGVDGIGDSLRRARVEAGLSIQDLAQRTKIQVSTLEAIERDDFNRLPRGLFTRGFLRAYAREVGVPVEPIVHEYAAQYESPAHIEESVVSADESGSSSRAFRPLFALTIIGLLAALYMLGRNEQRAPRAAPDAIATSGRLAPRDALPARDVPLAAAPAPAAEPLVLDIHPTRTVWLEVHSDGQRVIFRLLEPGERITVRARQEISLHIGDAEAFAYTINDSPGRPLGGPAQVRDVRITPENYRTFR